MLGCGGASRFASRSSLLWERERLSVAREKLLVQSDKLGGASARLTDGPESSMANFASE